MTLPYILSNQAAGSLLSVATGPEPGHPPYGVGQLPSQQARHCPPGHPGLLVEFQGQAIGIVEEADPLAIGGVDHNGIGRDAQGIQFGDGLFQIRGIEAQMPHTAAGGLSVVGLRILLAENFNGSICQLYFQLNIILRLTMLFLDDLEAQLIDVEILGLLVVGSNDCYMMQIL